MNAVFVGVRLRNDFSERSLISVIRPSRRRVRMKTSGSSDLRIRTQAQTAGGVSVKRFAVEVGVVVFLRIVSVNPIVLVGSVRKPRLSQISHRRYPASVSIAMVMANLRCHRRRCGQQCNGGRSNQSEVCHDTTLFFHAKDDARNRCKAISCVICGDVDVSYSGRMNATSPARLNFTSLTSSGREPRAF